MTNSTAVQGRPPAQVSDAQSTAVKLWVVLARAMNAVHSQLQASVTQHDLTLTEFSILEVLYHKGPLLLGEVQRRILVSSGGVTYLVDRLAKKGLVERRDCPNDRRARYAALTTQGEELIEKLFPEHAKCIEKAVSGLSLPEQRTAIGLLRALGKSAEEQGTTAR